MRLSISNIAWDCSEDSAVAGLLERFAINAIDIAPGKYFPDPALATQSEIQKVREWWSARGIEIVGMQSLLFGASELNIFGKKDVQRAMLHRLTAVCRIGAGLGATRLVFGSPRNRDRSGLSDNEALAHAASFFQELGEIALEHGVTICLEPNPPCYGANFMTTSAETAHVVRTVDHPGVRMQLDTGAIIINNEPMTSLLAECSYLIGHVHASEPNLVPLGDLGSDHDALSSAIAEFLPEHCVSIEMIATKDEPHLEAIARALSFGVQHYRTTPLRQRTQTP